MKSKPFANLLKAQNSISSRIPELSDSIVDNVWN